MSNKKSLTFCIGEIKLIPYYFPLLSKLCKKYSGIKIVYYDPGNSSKSVINSEKTELLITDLMKSNAEFINISFDKSENINSSIGFKYAKLFRLLLTITMYSCNDIIPEFYLDRSIKWASSYNLFFLKLIPKKILKTFFRRSIVRNILEKLFYFSFKLSKYPVIEKKIIKNTDLLLIGPTNLRFSPEYSLYLLAKKSKKEVYIPVLTWDNPSTKLIFYPLPHKFFAWNYSQYHHLNKFHRVKKSHIEVFGSLYFERFANANRKENLMDKDNSDIQFNFLKNISSSNISEIGKVNLPEKYLLYLGSSANIHEENQERMNIMFILETIYKYKDFDDYKIIIKPHPANPINIYKLFVELGEKQFNKIQIHFGDFPVLNNDLEEQRILLKNASLIIGVNTSAFLEAFLMGKNVYSLLISEKAKIQKINPHFLTISSCKQLKIINNEMDFLRALKKINKKNNYDKDYLKSFLSFSDKKNDLKPSDIICKYFEEKGLSKN